MAEVSVASEDDLGDKEVSQVVRHIGGVRTIATLTVVAVHSEQVPRIHYVTHGFGHLLAVSRPPTVSKHALCHRQYSSCACAVTTVASCALHIEL